MTFLFPALCLAIAIVFIYVEWKKKYVLSVVLKGCASLCFVAFGIAASRYCGDPQHAKLIIIGLILGCIADIFLNLRFVIIEKAQLIFITGILIFLAGHVMYFVAMANMAPHLAAAIAAAVACTAITLYLIFTKFEVKKAYKIFGGFYCMTIYLMVCTSVDAAIASTCPATIIMMIGAFFFLVSDLVLIVNTFGPKFLQSRRVVNLIFYYIGQLLIGLSLLFTVL